MGYMKHHAIVVTTWGDITAAHKRAQFLCGEYVTPVMGPFVNGYTSFAVVPDGSKEGWEESERGDLGRDSLIEWLRDHDGNNDGDTYYRWVEVQFGDDNRKTKVCRDSDEVGNG